MARRGYPTEFRRRAVELVEHDLQQAEVVENKRLQETIEFIKERQRERTEAKVAKPSTTLRKARLLRAGTPRRTTPDSPAEARP